MRPYPKESLSPAAAETHRIAVQEEMREESRIVVPTERPTKLHPLAAATEKALQRGKPDDEGFVTSQGAGRLDVRIGLPSIARVVLLIHSLLRAVQDRGHRLSADADFRVIVDDQPLALRIYESKDKAVHMPSIAELKRQSEEDERRLRFPNLYGSDRKIYRAWDYFPSGRLMLEISDPYQARWKADPIFGRWRDRGTHRLEDYFAKMMTALKTGGAIARHQRAQEAEEARIANEADERRRQQEIQRRLLERVKVFLVEKAEQHAQLMKLENLAVFFQSPSNRPDGKQHPELQAALEFVLANLRNQLSADAVNEEIVRNRLLEPGYW